MLCTLLDKFERYTRQPVHYKDMVQTAKAEKLEATLPGLENALDMLVQIVERNTAPDRGWLQQYPWYTRKMIGFIVVRVNCLQTSFALYRVDRCKLLSHHSIVCDCCQHNKSSAVDRH